MINSIKMPPQVDEEACTGCGDCVSTCPAKPIVFEIINEKAKVVHPDACMECPLCVDACPTHAIIFE